MRRHFAVYLSIAAAIVFLTVFVPSCGVIPGNIQVEATFCGITWDGPLNYILTLGSGSAITGSGVPSTHNSVATGDWICAYVSGGPLVGTYVESITPSATQTVSEGGIITFTLNLELDQDAAIEFLTWTVSGIPCQSAGYEAAVCDTIGVDFYQWVNGCPERVVILDETSSLNITQTSGPGPVQIFVVNDWCALNKTPEPPNKESQVPSINGTPIEKGASFILTPQVPLDLDVETTWQLEQGFHYTKSINWLGISINEMVPHSCVLFELVVPSPGFYQFALIASSKVELADDEDVSPQNDEVISPPLFLTVDVPL